MPKAFLPIGVADNDGPFLFDNVEQLLHDTQGQANGVAVGGELAALSHFLEPVGRFVWKDKGLGHLSNSVSLQHQPKD
jgi:hypothetical protein